MRKTITALTIGTALALAATAAATTPKQYGYGGDLMKPWEVSVGGMMFTDDLDDAGFNTAFTAGIDYYTGYLGESTMSFFGVRGWFGSGGSEVRSYGFHYGYRIGFDEGNPEAGSFYLKVAGGYYLTDLKSATLGIDTEKWGFGGFGGFGYEFAGGFSTEVGYQLAPSVAGVNNTGWYGTIGFRF
ncbi:MAG: hypothetical protein IH851_00460 [Armatimonadetes bacterium]|nr:hypothetical protein [Armatimonadota bacterium]